MATGVPPFKLHNRVVEGCKSLFSKPNQVQREVLPYFMETYCEDLVIVAPPYTGKTSSVILGILNFLVTSKKKHCFAVLLAPTYIISEAMYYFCQNLAHFCDVAVHFASKNKLSADDLHKCPKSIVVGTADKILQLSRSSVINLEKASFLFIDEADCLSNPNRYFEDIHLMHKHLHKTCRTVICTSSLNNYINDFVKEHLYRSIKITVIVEICRQFPIKKVCAIFNHRAIEGKLEALKYLIFMKSFPGQTVIFCKTQENVSNLATSLQESGVNMMVLSGDLSMAKRKSIIKDFTKKTIKELITTHAFACALPAYSSTRLIHYDHVLDENQIIDENSIQKRERILSKSEKCLEVYFIQVNWVAHFEEHSTDFKDLAKINCEDIGLYFEF